MTHILSTAGLPDALRAVSIDCDRPHLSEWPDRSLDNDHDNGIGIGIGAPEWSIE
jgi:hypothetical protein